MISTSITLFAAKQSNHPRASRSRLRHLRPSKLSISHPVSGSHVGFQLWLLAWRARLWQLDKIARWNHLWLQPPDRQQASNLNDYNPSQTVW